MTEFAQATDQKKAAANRAPSGFTEIPRSVFQVLRDPPFDTYMLSEGSDTPVLFGANEFLSGLSSEEVGSRWEKVKFYVRSGDALEYQRTIEGQLDEILENKELPAEDRFCFLQSTIADQIQHSFRLINSNAAVDASKEIGEKLSTLLQGTGTLPVDMFSMAQHDYYTFTHLTNVASYSVVLAEQLGIVDPSDLNEIAVGGLLHDIGKRLIPKTILNKKGRLTEEEFTVIQSHPKKGYEELVERDDLSHGQMMMVYQHHEHMDGTGYPVRITGEEMHPWARICAVVDVFDAMTCHRPYRKALSTEYVVDHLRQIAGSHLDEEMVRCWTSTIAPR